MKVALVIVALLCLIGSLARADSNDDLLDAQAKAACDQHWDQKAPSDPCAEAALLEQAAGAQLVSGIVYSVAATDCLVECFYPFSGGWACKGGSFAGMGSDIVGMVAVGSQGGNIAQNMATGIPMIGGQILMMTQLDDKGFLAKDAPIGSTITDDAKENPEGKKGDKAACIEAAMNGVQATVRYINWQTELAQARAARRKKLEMLGNNATMQIASSGSSGTSNTNSGSEATQGMPTVHSGTTTAPASAPISAAKLASSAESAGGYGPLLKNFQDGTGKPVSDMFDKVANGMPPLLAAADMAADKLGDKGLEAVGQLQQAGGSLADQYRGDLDALDKKSGVTANVFESTGVRRSPAATGKGGSGMPDMGALMAGLLGGKKSVAAAAPNVSGVTFGGATRAPAGGFYPPERSIFDAVGARYRDVTTRFLAGDTLVGKDQSLLPGNPYLRK